MANAFRAYARLVDLGKKHLIYLSVLARYAVMQVREGRRVGGKLNTFDVLSRYAQHRKRIVVERLDKFDPDADEWQEAVIEDHATPVPEQVAFRVDFPDWLLTASAAGTTTMHSRPHQRVGFRGALPRIWDFLRWGRFIFRRGQDRIAAVTLDLVSRRVLGVEQLPFDLVPWRAPAVERPPSESFLEDVVRTLWISVLVLVCTAAKADGDAAKSLRLVLPPQPTAAVKNIARVFARQVESRCDVKVVRHGDAPLVVELAVEGGIGCEGFRIADGADGAIRITGNDARGLLYGVGKFLHTATYGSGGFTPGSWRGTSVPKMPVRGIYLATHFRNWYQVAPIEDVQRYIEELSLWGPNSFLVWFGMEEFNGINDAKAQAMIARLRALLKIVRDLGLNVCLGCICNDGYANSPAELRADDSTVNHAGYHTKMGPRICNLGNELCPSKPGVAEMELGFCEEKFNAFKDIGVDYWFIWPYDNGGCTCPKCTPWGANGYLRMAEPLAQAYRREFPVGKVVLGTWYFDRWGIGEWDGITAKFAAQKPNWVDYIMADNFEEYPRYPLENGVPGGLPLLNFPDISMYGQDPWGGYGANPHPGRLQERWNETKQKLSGGFPYSEGIYEDLNKVICTRLYWEPDRPAIETVRDYAAYEFSPAVADDVTTVVKLFEENHFRNRIGRSAVVACELVEQVDAKLTPRAAAAGDGAFSASARQSTGRCTETRKARAARMSSAKPTKN